MNASPPTPHKADTKKVMPYASILATFSLMVLSVFVLVTALRPGGDNLTLTLAVIAIATPIIIFLSLVIKVGQDAGFTVQRNYDNISDLRRDMDVMSRTMDGRLTQLLVLTATSNRALGVKESEDKARADAVEIANHLPPPAPPVVSLASAVSVLPAHTPATTVAVENVETLIVKDATIEGKVTRVVTPTET